jgi:hypothetical protein
MKYNILKIISISIASAIVLIVVPSFMILRSVRALSVQEVVLWAVQLIGCIVVTIYLSKKRQLILPAIFGYCFLLLYNALAILCATLNYGTITGAGLENIGLALIGFAAGASYLLAPKMNRSLARVTRFVCIAAALMGISFVYCSWVPLLAAPGALILVSISALEEHGQTTY